MSKPQAPLVTLDDMFWLVQPITQIIDPAVNGQIEVELVNNVTAMHKHLGDILHRYRFATPYIKSPVPGEVAVYCQVDLKYLGKISVGRFVKSGNCLTLKTDLVDAYLHSNGHTYVLRSQQATMAQNLVQEYLLTGT